VIPAPVIRRSLYLQLRRAVTELVVLAVVMAASFGATSAIAQAHPHSTHGAKALQSISADMADIVTGLIADSRLRPPQPASLR